MKVTGKVYEVETHGAECPDCGEAEWIERFVSRKLVIKNPAHNEIDHIGSENKDCFMRFCKCGNVFIAQVPMERDNAKVARGDIATITIDDCTCLKCISKNNQHGKEKS